MQHISKTALYSGCIISCYSASSPATVYVIGVVGPQKQPQQHLSTLSCIHTCVTAVSTASDRTMVTGPASQDAPSGRQPPGTSSAAEQVTPGPTSTRRNASPGCPGMYQPWSRSCKPDRWTPGPTTPHGHCVALARYPDQHRLSGCPFNRSGHLLALHGLAQGLRASGRLGEGGPHLGAQLGHGARAAVHEDGGVAAARADVVEHVAAAGAPHTRQLSAALLPGVQHPYLLAGEQIQITQTNLHVTQQDDTDTTRLSTPIASRSLRYDRQHTTCGSAAWGCCTKQIACGRCCARTSTA